MGLYLAGNGPMQTTAAFQKVTSGAVIKTMQQLKSLAGVELVIIEWGISGDLSAAATPGQAELIETDVAATVTAYVSADITKLDSPLGPAADTGLISLGTAASGYTATAEGTITSVRNLDEPILLPATGPFVKQIPLSQFPVVQAAKFCRIRVTFGAAANLQTYIKFAPNGIN